MSIGWEIYRTISRGRKIEDYQSSHDSDGKKERERENRFLSFYLANPPLRETEGPANHPRYRGPVVQKPEIAKFRIP